MTESPKPAVSAKQSLSIDQFGYTQFVPTRWNDNDVYGHVNNSVYYAYMDTAVNKWLIEVAGLDPQTSAEIGLVISSSCNYHAAAAYPDTLRIGVSCSKLGNSSVAWRTGIFSEDGSTLLADGNFVHVFVNRETRRPVPVSDRMRELIAQQLLVAPAEA